MSELLSMEDVEMVVTEPDIISNTDNDELAAVKASVKEQLLERALPTYTPEVPNQQYSAEQLFSCKDCGDRFLVESSFVQHVNRRSVAITYRCKTCTKTLMFYNRCALLAHLRLHSEEQHDNDDIAENSSEDLPMVSEAMSGDVISPELNVEPDALMLSPLPKEKILLGPYVPFLVDHHGRLIREKTRRKRTADAITQTTVEDSTSRKKPTPNEPKMFVISDIKAVQSGGKKAYLIPVSNAKAITNSAQSSKSPDTSKEQRMLLSPVKSLPDESTENTVCNECCSIIPTAQMKEHYLGTNAPVNMNYMCMRCNFIGPTNCGLSAHMRIHRQSKPYICPECVHEFDLWASFSVHLMYTCFHFAKVVRYRCAECGSVFLTAVALEAHMRMKHIKYVYKCTLCPVACYNIQSLTDHKISSHGITTQITHAYLQCQLCPKKLIPKSRLMSHVIEHSQESSVRIYLYQCNTPNCAFRSTKKADFAYHKSVCTNNGKKILPSPLSSEKTIQNGTTVAASNLGIDVAVSSGNENQEKIVIPAASLYSKLQNAVISKEVIQKDSGTEQAISGVNQMSNGIQKNTFFPINGNLKSLLPLQGNQNGNNYVKVYNFNNPNAKQLAYFPHTLVKNIKKVIVQRPGDGIVLPKSPEAALSKSPEAALSKSPEAALSKSPEAALSKSPENNLQNSPELTGKINNSSESDHGNCADRAEVMLSPTLSENKETANQIPRLQNQCVCSLCKIELNIPEHLVSTNFKALCVKCSKFYTFVKSNNNKLMIVPNSKVSAYNPVPKEYTSGGKLHFVPALKPAIHLQETAKSQHPAKTKQPANLESNNIESEPEKSKVTTESKESCSQNDNYKCHICRKLVSVNWEEIEEHFSAEHPNYNLLFLKPKIDKLNFENAKPPFIVKGNKVYQRSTESSVYNGINDKPDEEDNSVDDDNHSTSINSYDDHDDFNQDEDDNVTQTEKEFVNSDGESLDFEGFPERNYFVRKDRDIRDIPVDYDLIPSKLKKKKRSHRVPEAPVITPFSSGQILPPLQEEAQSEKKYVCAKCEYSDTNVESFHKHIVEHRTDKNVIQCMECGLCFMVQPSFKKHLFISHRIKDVESYMAKNDCYNDVENDDKVEELMFTDPNSPPEEDPLPNLVENQCRVCRDIFDTAMDLNKHFRTHGMAFLLAKKRENKTP